MEDAYDDSVVMLLGWVDADEFLEEEVDGIFVDSGPDSDSVAAILNAVKSNNPKKINWSSENI